MLSFFASSRRDDWDLWLDSVTLVFGHASRLPVELELGMPLSNPSTRNEYIHPLRSVFRDVRQVAKQQLTKVSEKRAGSGHHNLQRHDHAQIMLSHLIYLHNCYAAINSQCYGHTEVQDKPDSLRKSIFQAEERLFLRLMLFIHCSLVGENNPIYHLVTELLAICQIFSHQ